MENPFQRKRGNTAVDLRPPKDLIGAHDVLEDYDGRALNSRPKMRASFHSRKSLELIETQRSLEEVSKLFEERSSPQLYK